MPALTVGEIFESNNCGKFKVISDDGSQSVRIEFIETGYTTVVRRGHIKLGVIKDALMPTVYGVGFIGEGGITNKKVRSLWSGMLQRCYSAKCQQRHPTYRGCTVAAEWHNFRNFEQWFDDNYKPGLHLDKDIRIPGNKVYSPKTCSFVSRAENNIEAQAKHYAFLSPDGVRHDVYNLAEFARRRGLTHSRMSSVHNGNNSHHKNWTKA